MNINDMAHKLTPDVYERLKNAVETGKWPNGVALTAEQKQQSMQLVMVYQSQVLKSQQHFTIGVDGNIIERDKNYLSNQFKEQQTQQEKDHGADIQRFKHHDI